MLRGMSSTLFIVVSAVVIVVTGLVVLTIFGSGMTPTASLSDEKNICLSQGAMSCDSFEELPLDWSLPNKQGKSCMELTGCSACSCVSGGTTSTGGTRVTETLIEV